MERFVRGDDLVDKISFGSISIVAANLETDDKLAVYLEVKVGGESEFTSEIKVSPEEWERVKRFAGTTGVSP